MTHNFITKENLWPLNVRTFRNTLSGIVLTAFLVCVAHGVQAANDGLVGAGGATAPITDNLTAASNTYSGVVSGMGNVTITGNALTNQLILTGVNTFTGVLDIQNHAAVELNGASSDTTSNATVEVDTGGQLTIATSQTVNLLSGASASTGGSVVINNGVTLTDNNPTSASTFGGVISGTGNLAVTGIGTFTLAGANTFTGTTTVNSNTILSISAADNINSSSSVALTGNAIFQFTSGITLTSATDFVLTGSNTIYAGTSGVTISGNVTGTGSLITEGGGVLQLLGTNNYSGGTTVAVGTLNINSSANIGAGNVTLAADTILEVEGGTVTNNIILSGSSVIGSATGATFNTGVISGANSTLTINSGTGFVGTVTLAGNNTFGSTSGGLTVDSGTLILSGTNTYVGTTTVASGATLSIANETNIADSSDIALNAGTLQLTGATTVSQAIGLTGASTINTGANNDTLSGNISGTGELTKIGSGNLTLSGAADNYTGATNVNVGTLTLDTSITSAITVASGASLAIGATGKTITGAIANNGTLNLGITSTTVTGAITGISGVIDTTIGSASAGQIVSTSGTGPTFTTSLTITPTLSGTKITNGDKVVLFVDTAQAAPLPTTTVSSGSALYTWAASTGTTGTDIYGNAFTAADIILTANTVNAATISGVNSRAASSINGLLNYTGGNSDVSSLASALENLSASSEINKAGAQLAPQVNGSVQQAAFGATSLALQTISSRSDSVRMTQAVQKGISSGEALAGYGFWMQGFGSTGNQGAVNGGDGFTDSTFGTMLGGDMRVLKNLRLGASLAFANTSLSDKDSLQGSSLTANSYIGAVYGTYIGKPWYVDANVSAGVQNFDSSRLIDFTGAAPQIAKGSFNTQQLGFATEFGYPLAVTPGSILTPVASFGYTYLNQDGYTESGAPGADLTVNGSDTYSARTGLGTKFASVFGTSGSWTFTPNARLIWQHEFNSTAPDQTADFVMAGGGTTFTTTGVKLPQDAAIAGLGLDMVSMSNWTLSAKYQADVREKYVGEGGMLQVRKDF